MIVVNSHPHIYMYMYMYMYVYCFPPWTLPAVIAYICNCSLYFYALTYSVSCTTGLTCWTGLTRSWMRLASRSRHQNPHTVSSCAPDCKRTRFFFLCPCFSLSSTPPSSFIPLPLSSLPLPPSPLPSLARSLAINLYLPASAVQGEGGVSPVLHSTSH